MDFVTIGLIILLLICVFTDLRDRKIYNVVTFPAAFMALIFHTLINTWDGFWFSFSGLLVGFSILFIPYLFGGIGAGDVKLLAVIGALKGTSFVLFTALYMALIGGLMALFILMFRKGFIHRWRMIGYTLYGWLNGLKLPLFLDKERLATTYPYGVAISGGAIMTLIRNGGIW